jgi:alpha-1,6-mannosyltransferase
VFLTLRLLPDARSHTGLYLLVFGGATLLSILAARSLSASRLGFLLLCAVLFRATLLTRAPDLSDDLYRYLWDARVAQAGLSPYAFAPADPALADLAPALRANVAHPELRTVYPPLAQATFRTLGGGNGLALKAFFAAADVAVVHLLWRPGPGGAFAAALYAFHPLPVTETAGQGHIDSLGVVLLLASLAYLGSGRRVLSGVAFAASALAKWVSIAALPALARQGRLRFLAGAAALFLVLWIPAARDASPFGDFNQFALRWDSNSVLYPGLFAIMESSNLPGIAKERFIAIKERLEHPEWTQKVFPYFYSAFFARLALALLLAAVLLWIAFRVSDPDAAVFASLAALLLASPTLHPWYLLWLLPFAAARREPAFLYLSFAAPVSYALVYPVPLLSRGLVYTIEYGPFLLLLLLRLRRAALRRAVGTEAAA